MRWTRMGAFALVVSALAAGQVQAEAVISQAYGGGGNSGAVYSNDFVELFNRGDSPVSLGGRSVQYASATGTGNFGANSGLLVVLPNVELQPGQYFLIQLAAGSNTGLPALPDPDAFGTINAAGAAGKFVLVEGTTGLGCNGGSNPCNADQLARIIDLLGWGSANFFEGSGAAPGTNNSTAVIRNEAGCQDTDNNAADFTAATPTPRNSASAANFCSGEPPVPVLSVDDVALPEGDAGVTFFDFTVSLFPASETPVSFDISTADGTAVAGTDYVERSEAGVVIAAGETSYTFRVDVLGNTLPEPDKTFFVNLSNPAGAELGTAQGTGTILNDDFALTPIGAIHGEQIGSPLLGEVVAVRGIVTARKSNGFFIQTPDGEDDGNPLTSEGLFIFTTAGGVPDVAQKGNRVQVVGTVAQFVPASAPDQLPLVQLTFADTSLLSEGHPLPAPVELTLDDLDPGNDVAYLERYIGMRVAAPELQVIAPTGGFTNTNLGTAGNNGVFYATHVDLPRPFREPGIGVLEPTPFPEGIEPPVFDTNPERLRIQSGGQPGAESLRVNVGDVVTGMVGVMDYGFATYSLLPDPDTATVLPQGEVRNIDPAGAREIAVGTYNLFNLPNTPNLQRLTKTSRAICEGMGAPAIVVLQESFGEGAISALAQAINDNLPGSCPAGADYRFVAPPNPNGSIQLALLYDVSLNAAGLPRAELESFELVGAAERITNPDGSQSVLNDRPPLVAEMRASIDSGETVELTVIGVHQRSLINVNGLQAPSCCGFATEGERVRDKRLKSAVWLADYLHGRQSADPDRPIAVLGDYNAFEFSDGFVDVLGIITGFPAPADEVLLSAGSQLELPLLNLVLGVPESDRYSYVFDGNAQVLDHIVVNAAALQRFESLRMEYARINADFAVELFADIDSPARASDHDPAVAFLAIPDPGAESADVSVESDTARALTVRGQGRIELPLTVRNAADEFVRGLRLEIVIDGPVAATDVTAPEGWVCMGDGGELACEFPGAFPAGSSATLVLAVDAGDWAPAARLLLEASVASNADDPAPGNNRLERRVQILPERR